ncbi:MAG: PepSY-associated TM helix domain-containing protein, partial [Shewanella sp.]
MKETLYRSMLWIHTWFGLLLSWLLLLVFFAGTLSYFRYDFNVWSKPEIHQDVLQDYASSRVSTQVQQAQHYLSANASHAASWSIQLPRQRQPYISVGWSEPKPEGKSRGKSVSHFITHDNQVITETRDSKGGNFFYRLHFDLHYLPGNLGRYLIGIATVFMLFALISGIVIHKRFFKDFFALKFNKGHRSWLDSHTISSVFGLPYHLVISFTGLIALMFLYMPLPLDLEFKGDRQQMQAQVDPTTVRTEASREMSAEPVIDIASLIHNNQHLWANLPVRRISVQHPGRVNSQVVIEANTEQQITEKEPKWVFNGISGELISQTPLSSSIIVETYDTLLALHTGRFANNGLRLLLGFAGLLGC